MRYAERDHAIFTRDGLGPIGPKSYWANHLSRSSLGIKVGFAA